MTKDMESEFTKFKQYYAVELANALLRVNQTEVGKAIQLIASAAQNKKNSFYIFGNGGSHAIAHHFGSHLKTALTSRGLAIRLNFGINFYSSQASSSQGQYGAIFTDTLNTERADSEDLVILISGSGDSTNVLEAADYCHQHKIPCITFSGFDGGQLVKKPAQANIVAQINDQQICEDVLQPLVRIISQAAAEYLDKGNFTIQERFTEYCNELNTNFAKISGTFLADLSAAIADCFLENRHLFVLAPEGHGLSVSAEHIAHNLNWDAVFKVENPPQRKIFSSPTYTDFSGVGNDRLIAGVVTLQQLDKSQKDDVGMFLINEESNPAVKLALNKAKAHDLKIFKISATGLGAADILQALGHITGRLVRFNILKRLNQLPTRQDVLEFLITEDMAQRRFLDKPGL